MQLLNLSSNGIKYSINNDGTLILRINDEYMIKISWAELRSLDMIISKQQSEALGIANVVIEKLKKGLDTKYVEKVEPLLKSQIEEPTFRKETKERFIRFLESYLSEDEETVEVFESHEIRSVLGQDFLLSELQDEFGPNYAFKELNNDQISIALLKNTNSN